MADGSKKNIEDVRVGDKVLTTDPETGKTSSSPSWARSPTKAPRISSGSPSTPKPLRFRIIGNEPIPEATAPLTGAKSGVVIATDTHAFWVAGDINAWVQAADLKPGMWLRTSAGTYIQITATKTWTTHHQRVHNLTIANHHTYYVLAGRKSILVHNCGGAVQSHPTTCNCVNGEIPKVRNGKLAGGVHPVTGVPFDENGFPDFSAWRHPQVPDVQIQLTGNRRRDFRLANEAAGLPSTPAGYTWHRHQQRGVMQLIERGVHAATGHTGGF